MSRKILGLVLAPAAAAAVGALVFGVKHQSMEMATTAFSFLAFSGYIGAFSIVLPAVFFLERRNWINLPALALLGVGAALLLTVIAVLVFPAGRGSVSWAQGFANLCSISLPVGFLAGVCFWFVVRPGLRGHRDKLQD